MHYIIKREGADVCFCVCHRLCDTIQWRLKPDIPSPIRASSLSLIVWYHLWLADILPQIKCLITCGQWPFAVVESKQLYSVVGSLAFITMLVPIFMFKLRKNNMSCDYHWQSVTDLTDPTSKLLFCSVSELTEPVGWHLWRSKLNRDCLQPWNLEEGFYL